MGPRVALAATLPESALDLVASCCGVQAHYPFTTSRWLLHRALDTETQGLIHDFARTAPEVRWHVRAKNFDTSTYVKLWLILALGVAMDAP